MAAEFAPLKAKLYNSDVEANLPSDPVWRERLKRREAKVLEDPEHHGWHLGRLNHCKWVAPVGPYYILYAIQRGPPVGIIRFLRFYGP
jgi:hypothetical protein